MLATKFLSVATTVAGLVVVGDADGRQASIDSVFSSELLR